MPDGPNRVSLMEGQKNFAVFGACELRFQARGRAPTAMDQRDPTWRPIDPRIDLPSPKDKTTLYYWRPDYWLTGIRKL